MIYFFIGCITGIFLSGIVFISILVSSKKTFSDDIPTVVGDFLDKKIYSDASGKKAEIFDPISPEREAEMIVMEENDKQGRPTQMSEL